MAVNAASAKVASGVLVNECEGDGCSAAASTKGDPRQSNRGRSNRDDESCDACKIGVPGPANKLAASADKLNIIRAVNRICLIRILA